jgi:hypothetical protein
VQILSTINYFAVIGRGEKLYTIFGQICLFYLNYWVTSMHSVARVSFTIVNSNQFTLKLTVLIQIYNKAKKKQCHQM